MPCRIPTTSTWPFWRGHMDVLWSTLQPSPEFQSSCKGTRYMGAAISDLSDSWMLEWLPAMPLELKSPRTNPCLLASGMEGLLLLACRWKWFYVSDSGGSFQCHLLELNLALCSSQQGLPNVLQRTVTLKSCRPGFKSRNFHLKCRKHWILLSTFLTLYLVIFVHREKTTKIHSILATFESDSHVISLSHVTWHLYNTDSFTHHMNRL